MGDRVAVMSKGVLQQVDAPQRLYDRPENLFVAGFIGTPPMNLLEGTVSVNGGVSIDLGGNTLPIADEALANYPRLRDYDGRNVIVGLRAGDLHPGQGRDRPAADHRARRARRVARRRVDGVLQGRRAPDPKARDVVDEEEPRAEDAARASSARGRTSSRRSRRTSSSGSATTSRSPSTRKNLHFFDEASGAPLR